MSALKFKFNKAYALLIKAERAAREREWSTALAFCMEARLHSEEVLGIYITGPWAASRAGDFKTADNLSEAGIKKFPESVAIFNNYAETAMVRQDWHEAIKRWRLLLNDFPEHRRSYVRASVAALKIGAIPVAEDFCRQCIKQFPGYVPGYSAYAEIAQQNREWSKAVKRWLMLLDKFPDHIAAYISGAEAYIRQNRFDLAEELCGKGLAGFPESRSLLDFWAEIAMKRKDWREARRRWRQVLERLPDHYRAWVKAAVAALEENDFAEADRLCREGIAAAPSYPHTYFTLAESAMRRKEWDEADKRWAVARNLFPGERPPYNRAAWAAMLAKNYRKAEEISLAGISALPDFIDNYILYADAAMAQAQWQEALNRWEKLLALFPIVNRPLLRAAEASEKLGLSEFARCYLGRHAEVALLQNNPEESVKRWQAWFARYAGDESSYVKAAKTAIKANNADFAGKIYTEAIIRCPHDADIMASGAWAASLRKDWRKAAGLWRVILERHPEYPGAAGYSAEAEFHAGNHDAAEAIIQQHLSGSDDDRLLYVNAMLSSHKKLWQDALSAWEGIISTKPHCIEAYRRGIDAAIKLDRLEDAERFCRFGLRMAPNDAGLWNTYAELAITRKDWLEADRRWKETRAKFPGHRPAYNRAAWVNLLAGNYDTAEAIASEGMKRFPDFVDNYNLHANAAMGRKDWETGLCRLAGLLRQFPANETAWLNIIDCAMQIKQYELAEIFCVNAVAACGKSEIFFRKLGDCKNRQGLWVEAYDLWISIGNDFPGALGTYAHAANAAIRLGKFAEAIELCALGLARDYLHSDLYMGALSTLASDKEHTLAVIRLIMSNAGELSGSRADLGYMLLLKTYPWFLKTNIKTLRQVFKNREDYVAALAIRAKLKLDRRITNRIVLWVDNHHPCNMVIALAFLERMLANPRHDLDAIYAAAEIMSRDMSQHSLKISLELIFRALHNTGRYHELWQYLEQYRGLADKGIQINEEQYRFNLALYYLNSKPPRHALNMINRECFDYKTYNLAPTVSLYTTTAQLLLSTRELENLLFTYLNNISQNIYSPDLYPALAISNSSNIDIKKLQIDDFKLISSAITIHASYKENKSIDYLKILAQKFIERLPEKSNQQMYDEIKLNIDIAPPYFAKDIIKLPAYDPAKKNIALLFSGFIRDYSHSERILKSIIDARDYNVFSFYYIFDRLGNIRIHPGMPQGSFTKDNGGLYNEIVRTQGLDIIRFTRQYQPTAYYCTAREPDEFYLSLIGITHPQWLMVYESCMLANKYSMQQDIKFDFMARVRPEDRYPRDPSYITKACAELEMLPVSTILTPLRVSTGYFNLCDQFAIGRPESITTYCRIGKERNFVSVEQSQYWRKNIRVPYSSFGGGHETHLGAWLYLNNIKFERRKYLD